MSLSEPVTEKWTLPDAVQVRAPSRLHFGLLAAQREASRSFGGVGLMIDDPAVEVIVRRHSGSEHSVSGKVSESVIDRAQRLLERLADESSDAVDAKVSIEVVRCPSEHSGLGVGTQLSLAVGVGLSQLWGRAIGLERLATMMQRGRRSGIGVHGFAYGGLITDGGVASSESVAPMVARIDFPSHWPVLVVRPKLGPGRHGAREEEAFVNQVVVPEETTAKLCELVLLGLYPAVLEHDRDAFGHALIEYNRRVGECYATVQGGTYADPVITAVIERLIGEGLPAAQSSWGPSVFAVGDDASHCESVARKLESEFGLTEQDWFVTYANNEGASITHHTSGERGEANG